MKPLGVLRTVLAYYMVLSLSTLLLAGFGIILLQCGVGQFSCSVVSNSVTPWTAACQVPVLHQLLELAQTHVDRVSDAIQPSHPLSSLLFLPSIFPSIRVISEESVLHIRWPNYWNFSISPSSEYSELISFRMDWLDFSLLQHHTVQKHQFFRAQLSL